MRQLNPRWCISIVRLAGPVRLHRGPVGRGTEAIRQSTTKRLGRRDDILSVKPILFVTTLRHEPTMVGGFPMEPSLQIRVLVGPYRFQVVEKGP
jgi:hypothetical protein